MKELTDSDLDYIGDLFMYVVTLYPNVITFSITPRVIRKVCRLEIEQKFHTIRNLYGTFFLKAMIKFYEKTDQFEKCILVRDLINQQKNSQ